MLVLSMISPGTTGTETPPGMNIHIAMNESDQHGLGTMRHARVLAHVAAAEADAGIAAWDAKFTYWQIRPFQADSAVTTVFPTPNHPCYPSNRSVLNVAPALVMGYLFPRDADKFLKEAEKIGESAIWAGIHFRSDVEAARQMGRALAKIAIDWDSK